VRCKSAVRSFLRSPLGTPLRRIFAGDAAVILYHRLTEAAPCPRLSNSHFSGLSVASDQFEQQIRFLSEHYRVIPLPQLIQELETNTLVRGSVAITFDDGYQDNLLVALPILERYRAPATIFITTGFIDRTAPVWWFEQEDILEAINSIALRWQGGGIVRSFCTDAERRQVVAELNLISKNLHPSQLLELMTALRKRAPQVDHSHSLMTWDQVRLIAAHPLITIGAHSVSHPSLPTLSSTELMDELARSRTILERELGTQVSLFSYPYGGARQVGSREKLAAKEVGYKAAVTTSFGTIRTSRHNSLFSIPRVSVDYSDTIDDVFDKISGIANLRQAVTITPW
jgi:peptidoglycan/xylan/chitin deacetylase (PgdA/CDA1 family)